MLRMDIAAFKAEYRRLARRTSYQRALEAAARRTAARQAGCWRFWAGYEHDTVGECQSSTEAEALARIEARAKGRSRPPVGEMPISEIGMVDIMAAWRAAVEDVANAGDQYGISDGRARTAGGVTRWQH